ncbi:MAG: class I SAM-dependent methyltransferase [Eubacteriales bacterium]
MSISVNLCKALNRLFPLPVHPFNLRTDGGKSYSEWQYEKGRDTLRYYLRHATPEVMFTDKIALDIGCGAAGKTVYYASLGAKRIYGLDVLEKYRKEADSFAVRKGFSNTFSFVCADAANTGFPDCHFNTIIMNDAMEHVSRPLDVLNECYRILKHGGRLYLNFPPYYHPFGAHLSDAIGIPWVHCLFREKTLVRVYKDSVSRLSDGSERINFRMSKDSGGREYFSYINRMTIKRFKELLGQSSLRIAAYEEIPLRGFLRPLAGLPVLREYLVKMVVCVLEK